MRASTAEEGPRNYGPHEQLALVAGDALQSVTRV
jgi:hypothetical protein